MTLMTDRIRFVWYGSGNVPEKIGEIEVKPDGAFSGQVTDPRVKRMVDHGLMLDMGFSARASVPPKTLGAAEPGDVFYLRDDPAAVYWRNDRWRDDYSFMMLGDEIWRPMDHVGTGMSDQEVIVVHNTTRTAGRAE